MRYSVSILPKSNTNSPLPAAQSLSHFALEKCKMTAPFTQGSLEGALAPVQLVNILPRKLTVGVVAAGASVSATEILYLMKIARKQHRPIARKRKI